MSLGLLAPSVLLLAALLAGPVIAHLTRQEIRDRRPFGAMLLLQRLTRRVTRRRRLSDRALLALRLLAIAAVLLAASRPELRWPRVLDSFGGSGRVVVVLDTSMSMDQRVEGDPAFALARRDAAAQIRALPAGVSVGLVTTGGTATLHTPALTDDRALVASLVDDLELGAGGTDLTGALVLARTLLAGKPGEVVVYTDESGPGVIDACTNDLERLYATGSSLLPRVYGPAVRQNVVPTEAEYGDGVEGGTVRVRLTNYGPTAREAPTTVYLPDGARLTSFVALPEATEAGPGSAEVRFTVPRQAAGGVARVEVDDPDLPMDNVRYFHLPRVGASRVVLVDGDPGSSPTRSEVYFLERALAPWGAGGLAVDVVGPAGLGLLDPERHRVVILANVADPGPLAPKLVEFVRGGGGVVFAMGENVTPERYNLALASLLPAPLRRVRDLVDLDAGEGVPLLAPEPGSELFRPFARLRADAFSSVRTRRIMTLEPFTESAELRTLLRFEGGAPALVERSIGSGRVLLWASTLDLGWGNFALQALYPPFLQRLVAWLGGDVAVAAASAEAVVGAAVDVPVPPGAGEIILTGPDGNLVASERETGRVSFVPELAGAYLVGLADAPPLLSVAVNTPAAESDVRVTTTLQAAQAQVAPEASTARFSLEPVLVGLAGLALVAAGLLARPGRRAAASDEATTDPTVRESA